MVYAANGRLYLRLMSEREREGHSRHRKLSGGDQSSLFAGWSLGRVLRQRRIRHSRDCRHRRGGRHLCAADQPYGMSWGSDGIVFAEGSKGIRRVSANGGTPDVLVPPRTVKWRQSPQMLPGGRLRALAVATGTALNRWDTADIVAQSVATGERKIITKAERTRALRPDGPPRLRRRRQLVRGSIRRADHEGDGNAARSVVAGVRRASLDSDGSKLRDLWQRHTHLHPRHDLVIAGPSGDRADRIGRGGSNRSASARSVHGSAGGSRWHAHRLRDR